MLVLGRKKGQAIIIGDDIKISVEEIRGKTVRLGITTPKGISVFREEIFLDIMEENKRAAATPTEDSRLNNITVNKKTEND